MTDEIRTTSSTGGEKGVKAQRYDLLPRQGLDAIAEVFAFGATKYADHNWRRGYEWGKSYAALQRHITAFWDGETNDPESGLPHLGHAGFHILVLLTWLAQQGEGGEFDDRYRQVKSAPSFDSHEPEPPRFVVGPHGAEDRQTNAMVVNFSYFNPIDIEPFIAEVDRITAEMLDRFHNRG